MNRGVYSAATAMASAQQWLDVVANNLANASTTGFKKDGLAFNDGLVRQLAANGGKGASLGSLGSGAVPQAAFTDFAVGSLQVTGNPLDLAIKSPEGAFGVETPNGVRYTRDGSFTLDTNRRLVNRDGLPVLNKQGGTITLPQGSTSVGEDGSVIVDGKPVDQVGVFSGPFRKQGGNLFVSSGAQTVDKPSIAAGSLESSNVNAVEEMVAMIRLNRAFELAQRSVQSQDESTQRLVSSLQTR